MTIKYKYLIGLLILVSCDSNRIFEDNYSFEGGYWAIDTLPKFQFQIEDHTVPYTLKVNIRNSFEYPFYNLFYQYNIKDSLGNSLSKKLMEINLFDAKTGEPYGDGLGDLFDHQQEILSQYSFPKSGRYTLELQQYMRRDSLPLILSVGTRIEKSIN